MQKVIERNPFKLFNSYPEFAVLLSALFLVEFPFIDF